MCKHVGILRAIIYVGAPAAACALVLGGEAIVIAFFIGGLLILNNLIAKLDRFPVDGQETRPGHPVRLLGLMLLGGFIVAVPQVPAFDLNAEAAHLAFLKRCIVGAMLGALLEFAFLRD